MAKKKLIRQVRSKMWQIHTAMKLSRTPEVYMKLASEGAVLARELRKLEAGKTNVIHFKVVDILCSSCL